MPERTGGLGRPARGGWAGGDRPVRIEGYQRPQGPRDTNRPEGTWIWDRGAVDRGSWRGGVPQRSGDPQPVRRDVGTAPVRRGDVNRTSVPRGNGDWIPSGDGSPGGNGGGQFNRGTIGGPTPMPGGMSNGGWSQGGRVMRTR